MRTCTAVLVLCSLLLSLSDPTRADRDRQNPADVNADERRKLSRADTKKRAPPSEAEKIARRKAKWGGPLEEKHVSVVRDQARIRDHHAQQALKAASIANQVRAVEEAKAKEKQRAKEKKSDGADVAAKAGAVSDYDAEIAAMQKRIVELQAERARLARAEEL